MKNFIFALVVMLIGSMPAFGDAVSIKTYVNDFAWDKFNQKNFNFYNQDLDKANDYIQMDTMTLDLLKDCHKVFADKMDSASKIADKTKQNKSINKAIKYIELNAGKLIQDKKERHRYFVVLNTNLQDRGFGYNIATLK